MFEHYIAQLADLNPEARYNAAYWLGQHGDRRAAAALIDALPDENAKVQYGAFSALIKLGADEATAPMIELLLREPNSRLWALLNLNIGLRLRSGLLDMIARHRGDLAERLIQALDDPALTTAQRAFIVRMLGRTGDPRLVDGLVEALLDAAPMMRGAAIEALGWIGDARAVTPLLGLLGPETENSLRELAIEALGRIGDPRALPPILQALTHADEWVRRAAAEALGELGDRSAIEPLSAALSDHSALVQDAAFEALKKLSYGRFQAEI